MTTRHYHPSPLRPVEIVSDGTRFALVFTREFPHRPESVWSALTDPDELRHWAPYTADRPLHTPGPVTLIMTDSHTRTELHGQVTVAEPPALLEFTWGADLLRWDLSPHGAATTLRLTHWLADRAMAAMMAAGWHICLDVAAELLAGSPIGPIVGAEAMNHGWAELNKQYSDRLGIEAIDPPIDA
ncbi:SRPBCC family protein [Nocardia sp. NPDC049220]|uniref:SRPBCC family protein n=1 Tax=Nocardia sp. NPDC049220 TaxID=3155273 RepID=UPI0033DB728C